MIKNIQIRIVILFLLLGVILIGTLSGICVNSLEKMNNKITQEQINNIQSISNIIYEQINNVKIISIIFISLFVIISFIIGIFAIKKMITPISDFVKNAKNLSKTNDIKMKYLTDGKGKKDVNEFVNAFNSVTTELNENLNEIKKQKKQIETILLHMTDGIIAFDLEGKITHINPASTKFLQLQEEDDNFEKIFKKLNIDINMERLIYLEEWTSSEQNIQIGDRYINIFFAPFKDSNEKTAGVIVLIQDVTEHVKLDNMRKEFVADVSHELKTPITSIMGYADTLLEGDYDEDTRSRFLNVIASEARRMAKLVTDLLTLSRYDNNNVKLEKLEFDLGELVKRCEEKLELEITKKHHSVECFVTANVPPVHADKYGIERVILNILTNSIKYTPENGNIKIYVGFVYNDAYIKVIDNGIGIPGEDLARIFDRFYRVDKARTREMGGTGLRIIYRKRNFRSKWRKY
ncbi:MAG: cell wall metabolism sensor histidine kinase WalK [Clostridia bacterium]|nr:cell wall metabolism sensor histidine kinase WalK [Clostridia bacterium]